MKYAAHEHKLEEINLRMHQVRSLKELRIASGVFNTEALMLILNKKYRTHDGKRMLFKYLDAQDDSVVMHKKETVLAYLNRSPYKDLEELVVPEFIVHVDSSPAGFAMPLIPNHKNLGKQLHSDKVPFSKKREYLIELGQIIDKVSRVEDSHRMLFSDLNEYNFIIDQEGNMKAVDLDSAMIDGLEGLDETTLAYYLMRNEYLKSVPEKYKVSDTGYITPNQNSDLYSYCMIVLNTLAGISMHQVPIDKYFQYLEYLRSIGVDEELVDIFYHVYTQKPNANPRLYLETLPDRITRKSNYQVFQKKYPST